MTHQQAIVSIVIPCYNHGEYLQEALDSINIDNINYQIEIIIVDDGSSDHRTLEKLESLKQLNYTIIHQENGGPGKARNTGINIAVGKFILPLDADNKIKPDYINKAVPILERNQADIVYAVPEFFGDTSNKKRQFKVRPFDDLGLVTGNCADACAIFRKEVWIKNGGYDEAMPYFGFEDWEFWINASKNNFTFHFIKEKLFFYRIDNNSMISQFNNAERNVLMHRYLAKKHADFFLEKLVKITYIRERYFYDLMRFPITPIIYLLYWLGILENTTLRAKKKYAHYEVFKNE
ncbi:glycosyltransferase family 2 protein [Sediminibacterium sp.]|jgi:glycosyltransferase involved in cell wall biosynthesis|uniref:glycosyltransferase family 2 protein n=1 Tax=Sediminibacterium sp. TaxID=1917865 RepID=UPI000CB425F3|nr:glycosyltransferase family 2 protein [Sediminibacterium sp.]MDO9156950.1 glycosyltransferase family 2 protein [Sediminibacterium sp.]MDP2421764.1 glycosyltransferase family 2 protein [Sediminibacterium sp.]PJE46683.1 MAG: glycosyltransferase family 2 protein [Sediminibacterium sp.] [Sediminibacterium sp. FEMGT703S]